MVDFGTGEPETHYALAHGRVMAACLSRRMLGDDRKLIEDRRKAHALRVEGAKAAPEHHSRFDATFHRRDDAAATPPRRRRRDDAAATTPPRRRDRDATTTPRPRRRRDAAAGD